MASTILHFGLDQCFHIAVLSSAGYTVEDCGTSIPELNERLKRQDFDAVAISGDNLSGEVVETVRSHGSHPLILFPGDVRDYDSTQFELVVPSLTLPREWLGRVAALIERSSAIRAQSSGLRRDCAALRQESAELRAKTAHERAFAKKNLQANSDDR